MVSTQLGNTTPAHVCCTPAMVLPQPAPQRLRLQCVPLLHAQLAIAAEQQALEGALVNHLVQHKAETAEESIGAVHADVSVDLWTPAGAGEALALVRDSERKQR